MVDWSRAFDDPIPLPGGGELVTLRDAGEYIAALLARRQKAPEWQVATRVVLGAAEGFLMHARIAMLRAITP